MWLFAALLRYLILVEYSDFTIKIKSNDPLKATAHCPQGNI
jgi:hypothetical protein